MLRIEYGKYEVEGIQLDMVRHIHASEREINPTKSSEATTSEISLEGLCVYVGIIFATDPAKNKFERCSYTFKFLGV